MSAQISKLRKLLKTLVTEQINTDRTMVKELDKMEKSVKSIDSDYKAMINNSFSRIVLDDGQNGKLFDVQIHPVVDSVAEDVNRYDVRAYIHNTDRVYKKGLTCEELCDFIKDDLKGLIDEDESYVNKALNKGKKPYEGADSQEYKTGPIHEDIKSKIFKLWFNSTPKQIANSVHKLSDGVALQLHNSLKDMQSGGEQAIQKRILSKELARRGLLSENKKSTVDKKDSDDEMEEVKKFKKQNEVDDLGAEREVDEESVLKGLNLEKLADEIYNKVWGAIKREAETTHPKTAKAEHDSKDSDTKKHGHTVTKQKRHSSKTDKMKDKPKEHETDKAVKGETTKVKSGKPADYKKDDRKAKSSGKDEKYTPSKKSKKSK